MIQEKNSVIMLNLLVQFCTVQEVEITSKWTDDIKQTARQITCRRGKQPALASLPVSAGGAGAETVVRHVHHVLRLVQVVVTASRP